MSSAVGVSLIIGALMTMATFRSIVVDLAAARDGARGAMLISHPSGHGLWISQPCVVRTFHGRDFVICVANLEPLLVPLRLIRVREMGNA